MKQIIKVLSLVVAPIIGVCAFLTGCKSCNAKPVDIPQDDDILRDMDVAPTQTATYEEASRAALAEYKAVADKHTVNGETDTYNEEVVAAANIAAAKLYAYACYNERYLDHYVFFSDQDGITNLGSSGSGEAKKQEYYLRVNESEETCGYRFHYTLKKVVEASGMIKTFKSQFESARLRMTDETDLLYRFEGDDIRFAEDNETLECDWETGSDWGVHDVQMVKSEYIAPEDIETDIVEHAGEDNITIRGNINILAENMVKFASIMEDDDGFINIMMTIDTEVANNDEASLAMLRKANGSKNCEWSKGEDDEEAEGIGEDTGLRIIFRLWNNGLFRSYSVIERWSGTIVLVSGTAESMTTVDYSYSDRDCDMTKNLEMLEQAKTAKLN